MKIQKKTKTIFHSTIINLSSLEFAQRRCKRDAEIDQWENCIPIGTQTTLDTFIGTKGSNRFACCIASIATWCPHTIKTTFFAIAQFFDHHIIACDGKIFNLNSFSFIFFGLSFFRFQSQFDNFTHLSNGRWSQLPMRSKLLQLIEPFIISCHTVHNQAETESEKVDHWWMKFVFVRFYLSLLRRTFRTQ